MISQVPKRFWGRGTSRGFSLIELLIVVAIILIIAAIAIPNFLRAKIAANESSAVASVRTINTAEITYANAYPTVGYAAKLADLGGGGGAGCVSSSTNGCLLDATLAGGTKSGYSFTAVQNGQTNGINTAYLINADPLKQDQTGVRHFCAVEDAVIHFAQAAIAACNAATVLQ